MKKVSRPQLKWFTRAARIRLTLLAVILAVMMSWVWITMMRMPGSSYRDVLPPLTSGEILLRDRLHRDVEVLAGEIRVRSYLNYQGLMAASEFLQSTLTQAGYRVERQEYPIEGKPYANLIVEIPGTTRPDEIIVIGGHYDSAFSSPAANDNGTGAAATLELARLLAGKQFARTLRFVEFVNEEPPFFQTPQMGSLVYAQRCKARQEKIVAMLSLETMGYYSDAVGSQKYPLPLGGIYPLQGNFIGFVGNLKSGKLVRQVVGSFRRHTRFPSEGTALPGDITGVGWSDHWAFWQQGYPALMVTDTAPFRYPYYHTLDDTPDKVDYDRLARVVAGLERVITDLAAS